MFSSEIYESWRATQSEKFAFLLEKEPDFFSGTVLDLACGPGFLERFLKENNIGCEIISTDTNGGNVVADANALPFPDNSFQRIICIDAIHLINNDFQRTLKKNGIIIVGIFFSNHSYEEKRDMLASKLAGLKILNEYIFIGKEKELFVVAKKAF